MASNKDLSPLQHTTAGFADDVIAMFSAHKVGIRSYDVASGGIAFANDFSTLLGLDANYCALGGLRDTILPDDRPGFDEAFASVASGGAGQATVKYRCVGSDCRPVWLEEHFFRSTGDQGKVVSYTSNADCLQGQEKKIKKLEDRYRKLVNALPDFIFVFDENFVFADIIMPDHMSLLHTREELIGSNGRMIFTEEVSELYVGNIRECLRTGQMKEIEYYLLINDIRYYFQARIVPFEDNKVFALIHDIGDRVRRMEELLAARRKAEEADRVKSAFLANMSHEIRTPLNAIVGFTEVAVSEEDPALRTEYMEVVRNNNNLLLQLINDILDLSRIESGRSEMNFGDTDIVALLHEVEQTHRFKMTPEVELRLDMPEKELWVFTDRNRVMQVMFNLLSNAIKNTQRGNITIRLREEDNDLKISVTDTGRGIPAHKLATIFDRFEKISDHVQGTGLGLAICQSLVERLGGEIGVVSEEGVGTDFWFTIPYRHVIHNEAVAGDAPEADPAGPHRKKILVAEDSEENFDFIRGVLEKSYDLMWVVNGDEAVSSFILEKPDMILMNIQMPVMNGIEATKKIRAMSSTIPIVAITANAFYMEQQWALESGCNDIISKPYSAIKLEEVVLAFI